MAYNQSPYGGRPPPSSDETGIWRGFGKWSVGFGLLLALLALLASLQLFQLTSEGASKRTLRRSVAALTEIDPLIDRHYDELQQSAQNAAPGDTVQLADFPIAIDLAPDEVRGRSKQQLRDLLLDRSADVLYRNGAAPLRDIAPANGSVGRFSVAGLTDHGLGFLRHRNHEILAVTTFALAALCLILALTLAAMCRGFGKMTSIGTVVMSAAVPVVIGGIGARFYMRIVSNADTEYIQREFLEIGQGLAWIPIRDGAAFAVFGLLLVTVGFACATWADRRGTPRSAE